MGSRRCWEVSDVEAVLAPNLLSARRRDLGGDVAVANLDEHLLDDDVAAWREGLSGRADSEWSVPHMGVVAGLVAVSQMWLGPTLALATP
jgi:hypothetical protein